MAEDQKEQPRPQELQYQEICSRGVDWVKEHKGEVEKGDIGVWKGPSGKEYQVYFSLNKSGKISGYTLLYRTGKMDETWSCSTEDDDHGMPAPSQHLFYEKRMIDSGIKRLFGSEKNSLKTVEEGKFYRNALENSRVARDPKKGVDIFSKFIGVLDDLNPAVKVRDSSRQYVSH